MMPETYREIKVPGIPDDCFIKEGVPLTKQEIRVLALSKLQPVVDSRLLDIGAGTGSVTVECGLLAPRGTVFAVEKDPRAVDVIRKNCERFGAENVTVIDGEAPRCLEGLGPLDGVFVGGSGGTLVSIIKKAKTLLRPRGRIVINAVLLETVYTGLETLKDQGFEGVDIISVSISRGKELGGKTSLKGLTHAFILWGAKGEEGDFE